MSNGTLAYISCGYYTLKIDLTLSTELHQEHGDEIRKELDPVVNTALSDIRSRIDDSIAARQPGLNAWREEFLRQVPAIFARVGFTTIYREQIPDEYSQRSWMPWLIVTTQVGHFKLGWRKRVIELDWRRTTLKADGLTLFKDENVTTGLTRVHCWSYEKLEEYLKRLLETA